MVLLLREVEKKTRDRNTRHYVHMWKEEQVELITQINHQIMAHFLSRFSFLVSRLSSRVIPIDPMKPRLNYQSMNGQWEEPTWNWDLNHVEPTPVQLIQHQTKI